MKKIAKVDVVGLIIEYESGELDSEGTLKLFAELIRSKTAWELQGSYGRTAGALIDRGVISQQGIINWDLVEELRG